jgi:hypothetical protein
LIHVKPIFAREVHQMPALPEECDTLKRTGACAAVTAQRSASPVLDGLEVVHRELTVMVAATCGMIEQSRTLITAIDELLEKPLWTQAGANTGDRQREEPQLAPCLDSRRGASVSSAVSSC